LFSVHTLNRYSLTDLCDILLRNKEHAFLVWLDVKEFVTGDYAFYSPGCIRWNYDRSFMLDEHQVFCQRLFGQRVKAMDLMVFGYVP